MNLIPNTDFLLDIDQEYLIKYNIARLGFKNDVNVKQQTTHLDFNKNIYEINNFAFRDKKDLVPGNPADILTLGCSQTYGVGLPQDYIWPFLLEKETKNTVANLGMSGAGAKTMLDVMMYYIKYIGKPKIVVGLFPDCFRYLHVRDKNFYLVTKNNIDMFPEPPQLSVTFLKTVDHKTGDVYMKDKFVRFPCEPSFVIPPQESIKQFFSSIHLIETICNLLDIKFYWGTYDANTKDIIKEMFKNERFKLNTLNYINNITDCLSLPNRTFSNESKKISDIDPLYKDMITLAADKQHFGISQHFCIVDSIMEHLNKQ